MAIFPGGVPDTRVYIFFDTASVDVTDYVSSVSINRGKSLELDRYAAGVATVTFHNDSRIFDPFNTLSAYYPNVVPRKKMFITVGSFRAFTGYINDWDFSYDISGKSFATLSANDGFMLLSAAEIKTFTTTSQLSSARVTAILNRPEVNWPAGERSIQTGLTTLQADVVPANTNALQYLQLVETSESGKLFIDAEGRVTFKNHQFVAPVSTTVVFADDGTANSLPYKSIGVIYGTENLYNRVTVTRAGGTAQLAESTTSQNK